MATKKEKHAAALRRHEEFMEARRQSGLRAQAAAKAERDREELIAWQDNHDKNHRGKKLIVECPHCRLEMKTAEETVTTEHADGERVNA